MNGDKRRYVLGRHDEAEGIRWTAHMCLHALPAWTTPSTASLSDHDKAIPITFVKCSKDAMFPMQFQERMIKLLGKDGSQVQLKEINAGHCPNASQPEELARLLVDILVQH